MLIWVTKSKARNCVYKKLLTFSLQLNLSYSAASLSLREGSTISSEQNGWATFNLWSLTSPNPQYW